MIQSDTEGSKMERPTVNDIELFRHYFTREKNARTYPRPAVGFKIGVELKITKDKGLGVFARDFIPAGTMVSEMHVTTYSEQELVELLDQMESEQDRYDFLDHTYGYRGKACIDHGDVGFTNHDGDNPNIYMDPDSGNDYAHRDIKPGEELTEDYRQYEVVPFLHELDERYGIFEPFDPRFKSPS